MRIAFLGNFRVSYTSESHYLQTLRKMGHDVTPLQESELSASDIRPLALNSDMFFWVHTHGWQTNGIRELLVELKDKGIPAVGYHLDLWLGIEREKDLETDPYWGIEYFFSVDKLMVEHLNSLPNMPKAFFLPAGVLEDECYLADGDLKYLHDVIFVGSKAYHKEWPYRTELITMLEDTYGDRFALYGRDGINHDQIRGAELNKLYASSKIVIGDTLCKGFNYPYYLSDRIFETTGRGGFIIHPYIKGLEDLFILGEELITYPFGDFKYLNYCIQYYLENSVERERIRRAGFERTKRDHTYTNRLTFLLDTINGQRA